jgi:S-adenosylmethionine synthetase
MLADTSNEIAKVECVMISKVGAPVTAPILVQIRIATLDGVPIDWFRQRASEMVAEGIARIPELVDELVAGTIEVF